jgi:hypothetical protein
VIADNLHNFIVDQARLREIHADLLRQHLQRLQESDEQEHYRSPGEEQEDPEQRISEGST